MLDVRFDRRLELAEAEGSAGVAVSTRSLEPGAASKLPGPGWPPLLFRLDFLLEEDEAGAEGLPPCMTGGWEDLTRCKHSNGRSG